MKKRDLLILLIALIAIAFVGVAFVAIRFWPDSRAQKYGPQVMSALEQASTELKSPLAALGVRIDNPGNTVCEMHPDPEFNIYECTAQASIRSDAMPKDSSLQAKIEVLDKALRAQSWQYGSNDFHKFKDSGAFDFDDMLQQGLAIHYTKMQNNTECYVEIMLKTAHTVPSENDSLTCVRQIQLPGERTK